MDVTPPDESLPSWPRGAWLVWVTVAGRLLVTPGNAPQPEPSAFPVVGVASEDYARALCRLAGRGDGAERVIEGFRGTIGDLVQLQRDLACGLPAAPAEPAVAA